LHSSFSVQAFALHREQGTISTDGPISQYGAITLGNNPDNVTMPTDSANVPTSFRFIKITQLTLVSVPGNSVS
jgi:hypothetical protein